MARVSLQQIEAAVDLIEAQLDEELPLEQLSAAVGLSRFALHRMFRACVGESLKGYIRKRRLTEAAERLKDTQERIIELALGAGFQSQAAFTRAFQGFFGVTPGQYRRDPKSCYQPGLLPASPDLLAHHLSGLTLTPAIVERDEPLHVRGWGVGADFDDDAPIIGLWGQLMETLAESPAPATLLGVSQASHPDIPLAQEQCLAYLAGAHHDQALVADAPVAVMIPPGLYAMFVHDGPLARIIDTVNYAWATWLPQSEYGKSSRPDIEIVPCDSFFSEAPHVEIWISIDETPAPL